MRGVLTAAFAAAALFAPGAFAAEPTGVWLSQSGETKVRIAPCGPAFCGTIVWVKSDAKDAHTPIPRCVTGRSWALR
jgi:uncharacterized protein (DUF2147 family)